MPAEVFGDNYLFLPKSEVLTLEEIVHLARVFCRLGVKKIRITGGEPLLRRGVDELISMLARIGTAQDLALTTNGALLKKFSRTLKSSGLHRVTVSLDALDEKTFSRMNGVGAAPDHVIDGIEAALSAELGVKINSVIQRGVNEDEILPLAEFARQRGVPLRFIEFMDVGNTNKWNLEQVVPSAEILQRLRETFELEPLEARYPGETAKRFRYQDAPALEIGLISSVSSPFCGDCNRIRLSADGQLFTCLFASRGHDLKAALRSGNADDEQLSQLISTIWATRDDQYSELHRNGGGSQGKPEMSYIGG